MKAKINGEIYEVVSETLRDSYVLRSTETCSDQRYIEINKGTVNGLKVDES